MGGWCGGGFARKRGLKGVCAVAQVGEFVSSDGFKVDAMGTGLYLAHRRWKRLQQ